MSTNEQELRNRKRPSHDIQRSVFTIYESLFQYKGFFLKIRFIYIYIYIYEYMRIYFPSMNITVALDFTIL
jgi:hypothetical protein